MTDRAATLVLDDAAALRAGSALMTGRFAVDIVPVVDKMILDRFCHRIGAGKYAVVAESGRAVAGDPLKLFHYLAGLNTAAPCE